MPLGIVPPLTTWERRNSRIVGFSDLFSGMFAAAHAFSTHGIMLHGIFFGFTFKTNLSILKATTREKKLFCRQMNQSRALFVLFQAVIGYISSNHGVCYMKN